MILNIAILLATQLVGEVAARALALPLPGPVIGMALLIAAFVAAPQLHARLAPTAQVLLAHLSLLFVPAGVGVIKHVGVLGADGPALLTALVVSTLLALAAGALTFTLLARITGDTGGSADSDGRGSGRHGAGRS